MDEEFDYKASVGDDGDANDHRWTNDIGQFSYLRSDVPYFSQSNAAYEGKKLYSENLKKYEDDINSEVNFKPSNMNFDQVKFRTSTCNDSYLKEKFTSTTVSADDQQTNNNPVKSSSTTTSLPPGGHKQSVKSSNKPETNQTKNKTLFFDPKRIFADVNKSVNSESDTDESQSEDDSMDLLEQALRFDAEMKRKLGATSTQEESVSPQNHQTTFENQTEGSPRESKKHTPTRNYTFNSSNDSNSSDQASPEKCFERSCSYKDDHETSPERFEFTTKSSARYQDVFASSTKPAPAGPDYMRTSERGTNRYDARFNDLFESSPKPSPSDPDDTHTSEPGTSRYDARFNDLFESSTKPSPSDQDDKHTSEPGTSRYDARFSDLFGSSTKPSPSHPDDRHTSERGKGNRGVRYHDLLSSSPKHSPTDPDDRCTSEPGKSRRDARYQYMFGSSPKHSPTDPDDRCTSEPGKSRHNARYHDLLGSSPKHSPADPDDRCTSEPGKSRHNARYHDLLGSSPKHSPTDPDDRCTSEPGKSKHDARYHDMFGSSPKHSPTDPDDQHTFEPGRSKYEARFNDLFGSSIKPSPTDPDVGRTSEPRKSKHDTRYHNFFGSGPKPSTTNPDDQHTSEQDKRKPKTKATYEGYSKPKRKTRSRNNSQPHYQPDNATRSSRPGRSRDETGSGWNQSPHRPHQMDMEDESINREDDEEIRVEAADGSGDALQQLFFGIMKTLVWFLGFLFFLCLVLLSVTIHIAKIWLQYTMVFLTMIIGWVRQKRGIPESQPDSERLPTKEELQKLFNLGPEKNIELPTEADKAVERLLKCDSEDPYEVLGVRSDSTDEEIKRYYRKQCIMVHPDKNTMAGAEEAFKKLGSAFEIIGEPLRRAEFHRVITQFARKEMFQKEFAEQFRKMKEAFEESYNKMQCLVCGGRHPRYETDRPIYAARYCARHDTRHPATDGDIWAESTHFGFRWHYYTCNGNTIYDVTEWAKCQDMNQMQSNAHEVRYRFDTRRQYRQRPAPPPNFNSEEDFLEEIFRQAQNMERSKKTQNSNTNTNQRKHKKKHKKKRGF